MTYFLMPNEDRLLSGYLLIHQFPVSANKMLIWTQHLKVWLACSTIIIWSSRFRILDLQLTLHALASAPSQRPTGLPFGAYSGSHYFNSLLTNLWLWISPLQFFPVAWSQLFSLVFFQYLCLFWLISRVAPLGHQLKSAFYPSPMACHCWNLCCHLCFLKWNVPFSHSFYHFPWFLAFSSGQFLKPFLTQYLWLCTPWALIYSLCLALSCFYSW